MLCHLDQPGEDRVGIDLKHAGHGPDAQAHRPHQLLGRHALAMQRGAMGLVEIAATAGAMQLAPGATVGVTVGTDIAEPHPALIRTVRIRAEMLRGIHLARPSPRGHDAEWRATGRLGSGLAGLLTGGTRGLVGEACKGSRVARALTRWRDGLGSPVIRYAASA